MSDPQLRSTQTRNPPNGQPSASKRDTARLPLGRVLIERGLLTPWQLFYALRCQAAWNATLSEILRARGWVAASEILDIQAETGPHRRIDLSVTPPDSRLANLLTPEFCLAHNVVPWTCVNGHLILATGRPDRLDELRDQLPPRLQNQQIAIANEADITAHVALHARRALTTLAESRVEARFSCRNWGNRGSGRFVLLIAAFGLMALALVLRPRTGHWGG